MAQSHRANGREKNFVVYSGDSKDSRYGWADKGDAQQRESVYAELGIMRTGEVIITFYRYNTPGYLMLRKVIRGDLKDIPLQIGLTGCAEPYDKNGRWLNDFYSNYDYNIEVLPSEAPADVRAYVDYFKVFILNLPAEDKANFTGNKLSNQEYADKINELMKSVMQI